MKRFAQFTTTLTLTVAIPIAIDAQVITNLDPVELPEIEIFGRKDTFRQQDIPTSDGGDYLSRLSGLSGSRMGGHGTDPIIRGQGQDRTTVLLDGTGIHGGCPNRMDPPTSYAPVEFYDSVRVLKGPQTLIYGPGGSGGTVLFERTVTRFDDGEKLRASLDTGYTDNGGAWYVAADGTAGNQEGQVRLLASTRSAGNYRDGDGEEVRSAYDQSGISAIGAWTPSAHAQLEIGGEYTTAKDVLFAGARMDSPDSTSKVLRLRYRQSWEDGALRGIDFDGGYAAVSHTMDNYSLRPNNKMWMLVPSDTSVWTGRLNARFQAGVGEIQTGFNLKQTSADGTRYAGPPGSDPAMVNSYMWPAVERSAIGVFGEYRFNPDPESALIVGLRLDRFDNSADDTSLNPPGMMMSPDELYLYYYGRSAPRTPQNGLGALVRYERNLGNKGLKTYVAAQRSLRDADPTERYLAANNSVPMMRWVGNPGLKLEQHLLAEAGLVYQSERWLLAGSIHGDWVDDYILRDRARGQSGIESSDRASIYRNVDASLLGFELEFAYQITPSLRANAHVAYVRGTNTTEDRPLAQIPPLDGAVGLEYATDRFRIGGQVRFAAEQDRVDDSPMTGSGLDGSETPGWVTFDLEGRYRFTDRIEVRGGVRNLFDSTYAVHVNRANLFESTPQKINEPGRSIWIALNLAY